MIRTRRLSLAIAGVLVVGVFAGACGASSSGSGAASAGSGSSGSPSAGSGATSGHTIMIKNFAFQPQTLTVKPGTKVTFTNEDSVTHTATEASGSGPISSGDLKPGQSYSVTFTKAGTYDYICDIHQYMKGTVIVQ